MKSGIAGDYARVFGVFAFFSVCSGWMTGEPQTVLAGPVVTGGTNAWAQTIVSGDTVYGGDRVHRNNTVWGEPSNIIWGESFQTDRREGCHDGWEWRDRPRMSYSALRNIDELHLAGPPGAPSNRGSDGTRRSSRRRSVGAQFVVVAAAEEVKAAVAINTALQHRELVA